MTIPADDAATATGYIVLAAYEPNVELFTRQLRSIRDQSVTNFRCLITADGHPERVSAMVDEAIGGDSRFETLGYPDRQGFYGNFERGLQAVPPDAAWVALSDQDDYWYPDKLATLIPHLSEVSLVAGQARVVRFPGDNVIASSTNRADVDVAEFALDNQFTGGQTIFRPIVLTLALPFPRLRTPAEVHDHWLAVCAAFTGGTRIVADVVQDYVQHGGNVIGESETGISLTRSVRNAQRIARRYEGDARLRSMARATYRVGVGWRETMADTLVSRLPPDTPGLAQLDRLYGVDRSLSHTAPFVLGAVRRGRVSARSALEYFAGWGLGALYRFRR
jgi:hypothetical protein